MTTNAKPLSAVDQALLDVDVEGFRLTDDIVIPKPTRSIATRLGNAKDEAEILEILCGDQYPAAKAVLEALPVAVEIRVLEMLLKSMTSDLPSIDELIDRLDVDEATAAKMRKSAAK